MSSDFIQQVVLVTVAVIVVLIALAKWYFSPKSVALRTLRSSPRRSIRKLKLGESARVVGRVEPIGELLAAPITGRPCVAYEVFVEERVKRGKYHHWRTVFQEAVANPFRIRDEGDAMRVQSPMPLLLLEVDHHEKSGFLDDAEDHLERFLARLGQSSVGFLGFNRTLRYREAVVEVGEQVAVYGKACQAPQNGSSGSNPVWISNPDEGPLLISDRPDTQQRP